jgi:hypothetical protein
MSASLAGNSQLNLNGDRVAHATVTGGRRGLKTKTLRRMLKKAGLKTSGRKAALTKRAKKAHLVRGGYLEGMSHVEGAESAGPAAGVPDLRTGGGRHGRRRSSYLRQLTNKIKRMTR